MLRVHVPDSKQSTNEELSAQKAVALVHQPLSDSHCINAQTKDVLIEYDINKNANHHDRSVCLMLVNGS